MMRKRTLAGLAVMVTALVVLSGCTGKPLAPRTTGDFGIERTLDQGGSVATLSWSPDGGLLAAALNDGGLRTWDTATYRLMVNWSVAGARLGLPAWSPDGGCIALADLGAHGSGSVRIFNSTTGAPVAVVTEGADASLNEGARSLSWSPEGGRLAVGLSSGRVLVLGAAGWTPERVLGTNNSVGKGQEAPQVAWSPGGRWLATLVRQGLMIWDTADWSLSRNLSGCGAGSMVWSSDGSAIGLVNSSAVGMISASNWTMCRSVPFYCAGRGPAVLSPNGLNLVAYAGNKLNYYKGTPVDVLNLTSRSTEKRLLADANSGFIAVTTLAWSPDGQRLATAYSNGKVILWSHDADGDLYADLVDRFPQDRTQWNDTDRDGYGDNPNGHDPDAFPKDPREWKDTDKDGMGDNSDPLPTVHNALFAIIVISILVAAAIISFYIQRRQRRALGPASPKDEGPAKIRPFGGVADCPGCGQPLSPYTSIDAPWIMCPRCGSGMRHPR